MGDNRINRCPWCFFAITARPVHRLSFPRMKSDLCLPRCPVIERPSPGHHNIVLSVATDQDRECIYQLRHEVYARELGQYAANPGGRLRDALDDGNTYLVAKIAGQLAGFISLTPPGRAGYSIDKYVAREALPFPFDDR